MDDLRRHPQALDVARVLVRLTAFGEGPFSPFEGGLGRDTARAVALLHALLEVETGARTRRSPTELAACYRRHDLAVHWAVRFFPATRIFSPMVLAAFAYAWPTDPHGVTASARAFVMGTAASTSPLRELRRWINDGRRRRGRALGLVVLRCLRAHLAREPPPPLVPTEAAFEHFQWRRLELGVAHSLSEL